MARRHPVRDRRRGAGVKEAVFEGATVIGAGAAGLAVAHALVKAGVAVQIIEKEDVLGEPWRRRHKHLHLNSHRDLSTLPGVAYPEGTPAFPSKHAVIRHLKEFTDTHRLPVEAGVAVDEIMFNGDHWAVQTNTGFRLTRHVVVATGRDRQPYIPEWKGTMEFTGRIIHSADFGDAKDYVGKKVLVVGAGNSGFDALNHLAGVNATRIWLSARTAPAILPKRIGKIAVHRLSPIIARLPLWLADAVITGLQRIAFGDLRRLGMAVPSSGGVSRLASENIAIATDDGAVHAIKNGKIIVLPTVREFTRDSVILADGSSVYPDVVIAATGYRPGLEHLVGKLGVLDGRGVPLFNSGMTDPKLPGLWFTGMRPNIRGCFANARIQAHAIAAKIRKLGPQPRS
ncbi:NAD(P)/FAD-dependent oxidoreductase [Mesorhizobium sp. INR15]|uniref:flavin-containing monooxygenase n=1 Tax=Mesorhizobium sp. INR15 TaxID=2654248 RepID=UPI0018965237|nr:NAD(P)/FAD-dependent oxidoreductase [Mesorhizobium sp. INR15]QPC95826.1 SidA/IucD/PvdA family monooxygenase [Mesorhizobium sp. INR15]